MKVWTQHLDPIGFGSNTGWLHPDTAIKRGAQGTIINHAEHKVSIEHVANLMQMLPEGFPICACAADVEEAKELAKLGPTYIAVEPPELIGGDISVTSADPTIVSDSVKVVKEINPNVRVLCGAGVKTGKDVATAIELGAEGVLLASGVTKAKDAEAVWRSCISNLKANNCRNQDFCISYTLTWIQDLLDLNNRFSYTLKLNFPFFQYLWTSEI